MTVIEKVKQRISEASIGSEEKNILRGILGELSRNKGTDPVALLNQWIKKNEEIHGKTRRNPREAERIAFEADLLRSILED